MVESFEDRIYRPLPSSGSIRLLKLLGQDTEPSSVRAGLQTFSLTDPNCPPFTAVSYTWGNVYSDETVELDGHPVTVLQGLLPLLRMLNTNSCADFDTRKDWFWIDSICINQNDTSERESQIRLMRQIYRQTTQTLVWLSEQSEETDRAIDFLTGLAERRHELRQAVNKRHKQMPSDLEDHPGWKALEQLLQNPWWRRVWTLQEFLLPDNLKFHCGPKAIPRQVFRQGMDALELCGPPDTSILSSVWTTAWNRRRISDWYHSVETRDKMSLVSLMAFCGDYGVTDPRDRIWAVHGLAREEDREMIGHPTYRNGVREAYVGLVERFVKSYGCLDIICYAQLFASQDPDWPSWVPDWRTSVQPLVVPLMVSQSANEHLANFRPRNRSTKPKTLAEFKASGEEAPRIKFSDSCAHLTCQGIALDVVDGLGSIKSGLVPAVKSTSLWNTKTADLQEKESLLHSLARSLVLDRADKYLGARAPVHQYARELMLLVAACDNGHDGENIAPPWFSGWWQVNKGPDLRIRGFTLEELCSMGDQALDTSLPISKTSKSFFSRFRGTMKANTRRPMATTMGHVGLAPTSAQKGDIVCILMGCNVPVILRKHEQPQGEDSPSLFEFVGECYVDGFMSGEALDLGKQIQEFTIG